MQPRSSPFIRPIVLAAWTLACAELPALAQTDAIMIPVATMSAGANAAIWMFTAAFERAGEK